MRPPGTTSRDRGSPCVPKTVEDSRACLSWILVNAFRNQYRRRLRSPVIRTTDGGTGEVIELQPSPEPGAAVRVKGQPIAEAAQTAIIDLPPELADPSDDCAAGARGHREGCV